MAATNRPDVLDPALLRPGRFDRRVVVSRPDVRGRQGILQVHTAKVPLAADVNLTVLARGTPGFSGADLANLANEAALLAARQNRKVVTMADFELAKDKVMMGAERRSMILRDEEKQNTAFHEAGHAVVAALLEQADPLHKVTIIPRGPGAGPDHAAALGRQAHLHARLPLRPARHPDGRADRGGAVHGPHDDRCGQRPGAGDGSGETDGLRVGHEPHGAAHLREARRGGVPGGARSPSSATTRRPPRSGSTRRCRRSFPRAIAGPRS